MCHVAQRPWCSSGNSVWLSASRCAGTFAPVGPPCVYTSGALVRAPRRRCLLVWTTCSPSMCRPLGPRRSDLPSQDGCPPASCRPLCPRWRNCVMRLRCFFRALLCACPSNNWSRLFSGSPSSGQSTSAAGVSSDDYISLLLFSQWSLFHFCTSPHRVQTLRRKLIFSF